MALAAVGHTIERTEEIGERCIGYAVTVIADARHGFGIIPLPGMTLRPAFYSVLR